LGAYFFGGKHLRVALEGVELHADGSGRKSASEIEEGFQREPGLEKIRCSAADLAGFAR
jgi:hypothetical protein